MRPVQSIPKHLKRFTLKQNYKLYTPMDHAGWRFIMQISRDFFKEHAHPKFLTGLPATGIGVEEIPRIEVMDRCLKRMGWRAAVVSGFIPPAVFLEFLSLGILPVACDMRTLAHLHYTPAPDIVHEAAGHAPILADPEYANYIRKYGEISQKVIFSAEDLDVYQAIRELSEIKEDPHSTQEQIDQANSKLNLAIQKNTTVSEATLLSRMAWWTIEYGLVGNMEKPLIYGAGLLSSLGESYDCFHKNVKKVPLTLDCINVSYDITKPQPQLFVTPNFQHLADVLEEFSLTMAYRQSAEKGLSKALKARTVTTTQWENGFQVSGTLSEMQFDLWSRPSLLKWTGPVQLSQKGIEISGHGPKQWRDGLVVFVGYLDTDSRKEFKKLRAPSDKEVFLKWEGGNEMSGRPSHVIKSDSGIKAVIFKNTKSDRGNFDHLLVVSSERIASVFGEAADRARYYSVVKFMHEPTSKQKTNLTKENKKLNDFYLDVKTLRDSKKLKLSDVEKFEKIHVELGRIYPSEWLLRMEMLEALKTTPLPQAHELSKEIRGELEAIRRLLPDHRDLIDRGLRVYSC